MADNQTKLKCPHCDAEYKIKWQDEDIEPLTWETLPIDEFNPALLDSVALIDIIYLVTLGLTVTWPSTTLVFVPPDAVIKTS